MLSCCWIELLKLLLIFYAKLRVELLSVYAAMDELFFNDWGYCWSFSAECFSFWWFFKAAELCYCCGDILMLLNSGDFSKLLSCVTVMIFFQSWWILEIFQSCWMCYFWISMLNLLLIIYVELLNWVTELIYCWFSMLDLLLMSRWIELLELLNWITADFLCWIYCWVFMLLRRVTAECWI